MAAQMVLHTQVVIENSEALDAFAEGLQLVREAASDLGWRDDLKEAVLLLTKAIDGMGVVVNGS